MAASVHFQAESAALSKAKAIPIASLDPSAQESFKGISINAVVTLIWPYSSSTQCAAFLVAEPDFRLRRRKGQIRIQLKGPVARAVGKSGIGIGDAIHLGLEGAQWVTGAVTVETPGRSVDGELLFETKITLQVGHGSMFLSHNGLYAEPKCKD